MAQEWGGGLSARERNFMPSSLDLMEDLMGEEELRLIGTSTPTFDSAWGTGRATSGTNIFLTVANAAVGADCFAFISWGGANETYTGTTGWTNLMTSTPSGSALTYSLWYRRKQAGDELFTFTSVGGGAKATFGIVSYTGLDPTTPYQTVDSSNWADTVSASTNINTGNKASTSATAWPVMFFNQRSNGPNRDIHFTFGSLPEHLDINNNYAATFPFFGILLADYGAAIGDTSSHSWTAVSNTSETYAGGVVIYVNPVAVITSLSQVGMIPI